MSRTGLDYCYDESMTNDGEESGTDECEDGNDCPPVACGEDEECLTNVCRQSKCVLVEPCGPSLCGTGEYCCNESCGVCAPEGGACIQEFCEECGDVACNAGDTCCSPDCGICAPPGGSCPDICTGPIIGESGNAVELESCETDDDCIDMPCDEEPCFDYVCRDSTCALVEDCGSTECNPEVEYCCNASCGICTPLGGSCVQAACATCGEETCKIGDTCCSPDCGICAPPGATCPAECSNDNYWSVPNNEDIQDETEVDQEEAEDGRNEAENPENDYWSVGGIDEEQVDEGGCQTDDDCTDFIPCVLEPCPLFACRDSQCALVQPCGENECNEFEYCCNESCSICVPFDNDVGCSDEFCDVAIDDTRTDEVRYSVSRSRYHYHDGDTH